MPDGNLEPAAYENLAKLEAWMNVNGEAIYGTRALQGRETATVPASSKGDVRYLYVIPGRTGNVAISGLRSAGAYRASLLGGGGDLPVALSGDFSPTQPEPGLSLSSPSGHAGPDAEGLAHTTDENTATKWCIGHGNRFPLIWQAATVGKWAPVTGYVLASANDMPDRDPTAWRFLGSSDGTNWTLLDEHRDEPSWPERNSRRTFSITNAVAFAHYRFEFLGVHEKAPLFQLSEIALLPPPVVGGTVTVTVPAAPPDAGVRVVKLEPRG